MPADDGAAGFTDLMVSSQTGSGKPWPSCCRSCCCASRKWPGPPSAPNVSGKRRKPRPGAKRRPSAPGAGPDQPAQFQGRDARRAGPVPTRELAQQVAHDAIDLVKHCKALRIANVVGGMPYQMQIAKLQNADLVVATPAACCNSCSARRRSSSTRCASWSLTRVTACWTWASRTTSPKSATIARKHNFLHQHQCDVRACIQRTVHLARAAPGRDRQPAGKARQHQAGAVLGGHPPAQAQAPGPLAARHVDQPGHRLRQHPGGMRRTRQRPAAGRLRRRRAARRLEPGRATAACMALLVATVRCRCWWPPTWPPAASTSRPSRTSSTTACR